MKEGHRIAGAIVDRKLRAPLAADFLCWPLFAQPRNRVWVPSGPPRGDFKFLIIVIVMIISFKASHDSPLSHAGQHFVDFLRNPGLFADITDAHHHLLGVRGQVPKSNI